MPILEKQRTISLVKKAAAGDQDAFTALLHLHRQSFYATAMALTRNEPDALDALQTALLSIWEHLPDLREPSFFKTWSTRILINACKTQMRANSLALPLEFLDETAAPTEHLSEEKLDVRRALQKLPEEDRLILQLFYFEDMPAKEIADALTITPEAARMRLTRARQKFKEIYGRGERR